MTSPSPAPSSASTARPDHGNPNRSALLAIPHTDVFFPLPVTRTVENVVKIGNKSDEKVAFRVRTTVPDKTYSVRPRFGILHPSEELKLRITLNFDFVASKGGEFPKPGAKDRFVVDARTLTDEESRMAPEKIFKTEISPTTKIMKVDLPCVFSKEVPESMVVTNREKYKQTPSTTPVAATHRPSPGPVPPEAVATSSANPTLGSPKELSAAAAETVKAATAAVAAASATGTESIAEAATPLMSASARTATPHLKRRATGDTAPGASAFDGNPQQPSSTIPKPTPLPPATSSTRQPTSPLLRKSGGSPGSSQKDEPRSPQNGESGKVSNGSARSPGSSKRSSGAGGGSTVSTDSRDDGALMGFLLANVPVSLALPLVVLAFLLSIVL